MSKSKKGKTAVKSEATEVTKQINKYQISLGYIYFFFLECRRISSNYRQM